MRNIFTVHISQKMNRTQIKNREILKSVQQTNMISQKQNVRPVLSLEQKVNCDNIRRAINRTFIVHITKSCLVVNFILILMLLSSVASHDPWGENLQPKLHTDYLNEYSGRRNK